MFYEWTVIVGLFIGATIGSFLNVVIYRMPRAISLSNPKHSFCPSCKHQLHALDLFPLLSWLVLRGKCRHCRAKVPSRYFFVELVTGIIWAAIWWQYLVATWDPGKGIAFALAASALVAVIFIDWEFYIIPDQINAFLLFVGLGYNIYLYAVHSPKATVSGIPSSLVGAFTGFAVLWFITLLGRLLFGKDAMGHGDIKMARGIGAVLLAPVAVMSFGLAILLGSVLGVTQVLIRMQLDKRKPAEPEMEDDEPYVPESIASIFKCGLGYLLCIDVIGLFLPKLYMKWFNEDPFAPVVVDDEVDDDFEIGKTMIPFGPYLALGAIFATVFEAQLQNGLLSYERWAGIGPALLEHLGTASRL